MEDKMFISILLSCVGKVLVIPKLGYQINAFRMRVIPNSKVQAIHLSARCAAHCGQKEMARDGRHVTCTTKRFAQPRDSENASGLTINYTAS
jgi:hypothetical protein